MESPEGRPPRPPGQQQEGGGHGGRWGRLQSGWLQLVPQSAHGWRQQPLPTRAGHACQVSEPKPQPEFECCACRVAEGVIEEAEGIDEHGRPINRPED